MKKKLIILLICVLGLALLCVSVFFLVWNGIIPLNATADDKYPVRGVDVSHYQGEIDWSVLAGEDIDFAFLKATEGSSYVDETYEYNCTEAKKAGLCVGAYHFFSFDSSAKTQAENFISTVEPFEGMLPPVVDFEFYGDKEKNPPDREKVCQSLCELLDMLEEHYGMKPVIYATEISYDLYLSGDYGEYDIWIRNVITRPKMSDGREWTFWQYTNRGLLDGYSGEERFIDINVFSGTKEEFESYPRYKPEDNEED